MTGVPTTIAQIDALLAAGGIDQKTANYWEARKAQLSIDLQLQAIADAVARAKASGDEKKYFTANISDYTLVQSLDAVTKAQLGAQNQVTDAVRLLGTSKSPEETAQITQATELLKVQTAEANLKLADHTANTALASDVARANIAQSQASAASSGASAAASMAQRDHTRAVLEQLKAKQQRDTDFQVWQTSMNPKRERGEITDDQYRAGLESFMSSADAVMSTQIQLAQLQATKDSQTQLAEQFKVKLGFDEDQATRAATQWKASFDQAVEQFTQTKVWKQAEIDLGNRNAQTQENQLSLAQKNAEAQARQAQVQNVQSLSALQTRRQEAANQAMTSFEQYGVATPGRIASLNELRAPLPAGQAAAMLGMSADDPEFQKVWGTYNKALTGTSPGEVAGNPQGTPEGIPPVPVPGGPDFSGPAPLPPISTNQYQGFSPFAAGLGMPGVLPPASGIQPPAPGITGGMGGAPPMVSSFTNGLMMQRGLVPV